MNNLNTLIEQFCPAGVEFKELGDVILLEKGKQLNKELLTKTGKYPAYNGGTSYSGFTDYYNYNENTIIISQGGASAGFVNFVSTKFYANAHCYVVLPKIEIVKNKYVYHFLKLNQEKLTEKQHGAGIPALRTSEILRIQIPIPPLTIQQEIVNILDKFIKLEAELEAELEARIKQYEYYRNNLLCFNDRKIEWRKLGEVCDSCSGGTPSKAEKTFWINGTIPWLKSEVCKEKSVFSANDYITELGLKKSSAKLLSKNTTLIAMVGATKCITAFLEFEASTNQNIAAIKSKDENLLLDKFVFYVLMSMYNDLIKTLGQYDMLNLSQIREIKIPIPQIEEQRHIVSILDKFDKLVNDISVGLPAEIEARKKQYNYYRRKLLDFKNISNG